jgi:hypothetical protein
MVVQGKGCAHAGRPVGARLLSNLLSVRRASAQPGFGEQLVFNLSRDLQARLGRGFGRANLF